MKRLIGTIIALFAFLVAAFVVEVNKQTTVQKEMVVGILQTMSHPALDQIHCGIIKGLEDEGYREGKNIQIGFQNAQGDQSNLKSMSDRFNQRNAAVTIGIATPAVQSLANESGDTPVIMGAVSDPLGTHLVKSLNHPGGKVTGVQDRQPIPAQLKLLRTILPKAKRIGVVYTSSDDSSASEYREFRKLAEKEGLTVRPYTITSTNDIEQVAQTMAGKVQAVYVPTDNTVASVTEAASFTAPKLGVAEVAPTNPATKKDDKIFVTVKDTKNQKVAVLNANGGKLAKTVSMGLTFTAKDVKKTNGKKLIKISDNQWLDTKDAVKD